MGADKTTTVYVSSTYEDLKEYRAAVERRLRQLTGVQVRAMEDYVARDERPKDACIADVQGCDVYVGIFAWRYGFVPPGETTSITELEFRAARAANKHCLIFLVDEQANWNPQRMDHFTGDAEGGKRIQTLRKELRDSFLTSFFNTAEDLASTVTTAVRNWEAARAGTAQSNAPAAALQPLFRELTHSLFVACAPTDRALGLAYAEIARPWVPRKVNVSLTALFADDGDQLSALDRELVSSEAGLVILTPATVAQLEPRTAQVTRMLRMMRARLGEVRLLACGDPGFRLPAAWVANDVLAAPAAAPNPTDAIADALRDWIVRTLGRSTTSVGLPFCVLAMNGADLTQLSAPGAPGQEQLLTQVNSLSAAGVDWKARYGDSAQDWRPFGADGPTIFSIVADVVAQVNRQPPAKLRNRRIKPQWYPFDVLLDESQGRATQLGRVYRDMSRAGCVLVVDELSLLNPLLLEAFRTSPLVNNPQVALVTVSPDQRRSVLDQMLESEARKKLVGAIERYETDYDPQCELAVSDPRRLKRWLHASLPETATTLRDPRPDSGRMEQFFNSQLGASAPDRSSGDYSWGGARQP
jgi:Domain of unknown function (DUF4062)